MMDESLIFEILLIVVVVVFVNVVVVVVVVENDEAKHDKTGKLTFFPYSPAPSQPSSSSQQPPSKDPSDWLALATTLKTLKMSARRSAHSGGGHSSSSVAIVEAHSPATSATSSHRSRYVQ
jgi:hypothetical protein